MTKASLAFALSVLTCALPLCALQTTQEEAERWSFHLGNRTLFLLSFVPRQSADGWSCTGSIMAPMHLQTRDAVTFTGVHGPVRTRPILACSRAGDAIALTTQDSDKAGDTTNYVFTVQSSSRATLQVKGTPLPPMEMAPAGADAAVSTDWDPAKTYATDDDVPSSADMKRIFEEDQRARMPGVKISGGHRSSFSTRRSRMTIFWRIR